MSGDNTLYVFLDAVLTGTDPSQPSDFTLAYMKRSPNGAWSAPIRIPGIEDNVNLSNLGVDIDSNNLVHFAWAVNTQDPHNAPFPTTRAVYDAWMDPTGSTSLPRLVDRTVVNNQINEQVRQIQVGQDGSVYVVFAEESLHAYLSQMAGQTVSGASTLSQSIQVPPLSSHPGLSFLYQFNGSPTPQNNFTVQVTLGSDSTTLFSTALATPGWTHQWLDLSAYAGQAVTLTFSANNLAGYPATGAYLDEVSLGPTNPDAWVSTRASVHALPGSQVTVPLTYGNQGRVPAAGSQLTLTLPAGLTFVSASIDPSSNAPYPTWALGDLPAQSAPATLWVTLQVAATVPTLTPLAYSASILSTSTELETANNVSSGAIDPSRLVYLPILER